MWWLTALAVLALAPAPDYSAEGLKALEDKNYELAVQLLTKAAEADPKDYYSRFNLAFAYSATGKDAEASQAYRQVLEIKPDLFEARLNLGITLLKLHQPAEAVPLLDAAAQQKPDQPRPRLHLAHALFDSADFARAVEAYRKASELDPKSAQAELGLARSLMETKQFTEAEPHFRKAAALDPQYHDAVLELAGAYEKAGRPADAVPLYREFPDNAAARERLGELLLESNQAGAAIPQLEAAVAKSPTSANRLALAQAYAEQHQLDKAAPLLQQLSAAEPQNLDLHMRYGRVLRDLRNFQGAGREFYAAVKLKPDSAEAWNELALMLVSLEQYPQALTALDRLKALNAEKPGHLFLRAIILDKAKDQKNALAAYRQFLAVAGGKFPDQEFQSRQRARILEKELSKR